jgi:hypothetical protein
MAQGRKIMKQLDTAPGLIGWSLAAKPADARVLHALRVGDAASLRASPHGEALTRLKQAMRRESVFVQFTVQGRDLPLRRTTPSRARSSRSLVAR